MEKKAVLLIEDNSDDAALALRAFKQNNMGNQVALVDDGLDALDYLNGTGNFAGRDPNNLPDLVLLDLKLPKLDGFGFLQRVRADDRTKHLPVVVLTSSGEDQDKAKAYGLGANSYIQKPTDFQKFAEAVRLLIQYWLALNQPPPLR